MSFEVNTVAISGNLTADPELRSLPSGTSVCKLRIAHNDRRKDGETWVDVTYYFDVTIWGGQGEWVGRNVSKGTKVVAQGKLKWREWEKDGNKRQAVDITAENIVVMRDGGGGGGGGGNSSSGFSARDDDFAPAPAGGGSAGPAPDDDIPF